MNPAQAVVAEEVSRLVERCGGALRLELIDEAQWRIEPVAVTGLGVALRVEASEITVGVGPWQHTLAGGPDLADARDSALLALDLVAAAAFGDLVLRESLRAGELVAWSLLLRSEAGERELGRGRVGRWRLFAGDSVQERRNLIPRPVEYQPAAVVAPAWAPWSGRGGFVRAESGEAAALAIDGELDLHNFAPKEVAPLLAAYIDEALARGLGELRVVHGKGKGALRRTVHALLERHPAVESYRLGSSMGEGGWGATIVCLRERLSAAASPCAAPRRGGGGD